MSVALGDIRDVEGFVGWQVRRTLLAGRRYGFMEGDLPEGISEGVVLLFELYNGRVVCSACRERELDCRCEEPGERIVTDRWDPERCASFSAFALTYLPKRLIGWWRKELRQAGRGVWSGKTGQSGIRATPRVSYDAMLAAAPTPDHIADRSLTTEIPG